MTKQQIDSLQYQIERAMKDVMDIRYSLEMAGNHVTIQEADLVYYHLDNIKSKIYNIEVEGEEENV